MSINLRKQNPSSVSTPDDTHVQLFVGPDGALRVVDSSGAVSQVLTGNKELPANSLLWSPGNGMIEGTGIHYNSPANGLDDVTQINGTDPTKWVTAGLTAFTPNGIARFEGSGGSTGHEIKSSPIAVDDSGNVTAAGMINGVHIGAHASRHKPGGADAIGTFGSAAGTFCEGNDARLNNSRTPTAHASTHAPGAADPIPTGTTSTTLCIGNDSRLADARTPTAHQSSHLPLGADPLTSAAPATLVVGQATNQIGSANSLARSDHVHAMPAFGSIAGTFCQGNDSRLTPLNVALNGFRLSCSSTDPIANQTTSTLYLTEYDGKQIGLYVTSMGRWVVVQPSNQPSMTLSGLTTGTLYDVFAYSTDGTNVQLERLAWSSSSARATSINRNSNGGSLIWTKFGDDTRRYIGTFRATSGTQTTLTSNGVSQNASGLNIWNVDNRVQIPNQWLYGSQAPIGATNSWVVWPTSAAGFEYVQGLFLDPVYVAICGSIYFPAAADAMIAPGVGSSGATAGSICSHISAQAGWVLPATGQVVISPSSSVGLFYIRPMVYVSNASCEIQGITQMSGNERPGMQAIFWG